MEDKIKLEEELEFLKESFEAEVISKEEYEKTKARIENQFREIEAKEKIEEEKAEVKEEEIKAEVKEEEPVPEVKKEEVKEEEPEIKEKEAEKKVEEKKPEVEEITAEEKPIEKKEEVKKEEPEIEIKEIKESSRFEGREEEGVKKEFEKEEPEEIKDLDEKEEDTNDILNSKSKFELEEEKKKRSIWVPVAAVVFLIVIGYFSFLFFAGERQIEESIEEILPLCFSDNDCEKEGMIGFCNNPGSEDAECEFKEAVQVNFIVLNTKDCFNCDTSRVEKIIKGWFPGAVKEEIEFKLEEGKLLVKELDIELLPAYIFNSSLESTFKYKELGGIFSKVNDKYVLSSGASGSSFYVDKQAVPNRLDVFLMKDDSSTEKAEENMKEFLDLFNDKIEYNKYLVDKENSLIKTLGINTFPTFLINNKIRFSGVQPAETIKENFCKLNKLDECSEKLTESLV